jgi:hypothetical protein
MAAGAAAPMVRPPSAGAARRRGSVAPANLELVTLTEDTAILTWCTGLAGSDDGLGRMEPAPADGEVLWGTDPGRLDQVAGDPVESPYHRVEVTGLEPGRTYYYQARSNGLLVPPTPFTITEGNAVGTTDDGLDGTGPYGFETPQPPAGSFLFSVVLCNDTHVGETEAGLVGGIPSIAGISQVPGLPPYPEVMLESLVEDASALGATYLLAAGDITAEAVPVDLSRAGELFGGFGQQREQWFLARGNHDRAHEGAAWASCSAGRWEGNDCFVDAFFPGGSPTWFAEDLHGLRIIGLDTYDKPGGGGDAGALSEEQLAWFQEQLADEREQPTLVFGHHPLVVEGSPYPQSDGSALEAAQAAELVDLYADSPGVFLHHAGHTHRNKRTALAGAPDVVHQEVAAVKEYPGGFTLLRVHTDGYAMNFHKSSSDQARAWSERSRMEINGTWPQFSFGSQVGDRNVVVERDLSGIQAPPAASGSSGGGAPSSDGDDGGAPLAALGVGAAAVLAGVGGAVAWRSRRAAAPQ